MKFRVIVNKVHFYTTTTAIKRGVGDHIPTNNAVLAAYDALMKMRDDNSLKPVGLSGFWHDRSVQIDIC
jgi:hypothetical protein